MQTNYVLNDVPTISGAKIGILQAKWYREITDGLIEKCQVVLQQADCDRPEVHLIPGSFELPLAAQTLIKNNRGKPYDAIILVGAILKGETLHFDMIVNECTRGAGRVMLDYDVPVILEVLPVLTVDQLKARCGDDEFNKGYEAALAAIEMISWRRQLT